MSALKDRIESLLLNEGYIYSSEKDDIGKRHFVTNAGYTNCYGGKSRSPFVVNHPSQGLTRIECRSQHQSGTTDQKFPYLLECAKGMPEENIIFVVSGTGFKTEALTFFKKGALAISSRNVSVMTLNEFEHWLTNAKSGHCISPSFGAGKASSILHTLRALTTNARKGTSL